MSVQRTKAGAEYGRRAAAKLLAGRKGHGGGPCSRRVLYAEDLAAVCAAAFDMGRDFERLCRESAK